MTATEEAYYVARGMEEYGGSFIKALGMALYKADMNNTNKIKDTWPNEWNKYLEMGKTLE